MNPSKTPPRVTCRQACNYERISLHRVKEHGLQDSEFDTRLERVRKAAEVIVDLPTEALQADAFHYLLGKTPLAGANQDDEVVDYEPEPDLDAPADSESEVGTAGKMGSAAVKKAGPRQRKPANVNPDKAVELSPGGKQSFADFVAEKKPASHIEKYTASVYWLLEVAEYDKATIAQIVTCYHDSKWALPTDIRNTAAQAGRKQLDNSDGLDDIRLSSLGRNLILGLPKATK